MARRGKGRLTVDGAHRARKEWRAFSGSLLRSNGVDVHVPRHGADATQLASTKKQNKKTPRSINANHGHPRHKRRHADKSISLLDHGSLTMLPFTDESVVWYRLHHLSSLNLIVYLQFYTLEYCVSAPNYSD
ncbi:hypothetical protein ZEAMMB73_Zm00001d037311 [Zea mays]|uniref:Uncharacterized protein n=1 Tax=Zea mays TaxID=4577 RepID=A0A1D6LWB8_MAIZE|nr:hypothetical protein ZEAMMB73_Zm00001d037311 [Zea mays]